MELKVPADDRDTYATTIPADVRSSHTALTASVAYFSLAGWMIPLPDPLLSGFSVFYCP